MVSKNLEIDLSDSNSRKHAREEVLLTDSDSEDSVKEIEMNKASHTQIGTPSDTCESPKSSSDKQTTFCKLKRKYKKKVIYRCQLFAPTISQAAQHTKNIIRYFTWYGQTLRNVQSRVVTKVPWGKPIDACQYTKGTGSGLLRRGKRNRTNLTKSSFNFDDSSEDEFLPFTKRKKTEKSIVNENENTSKTTANAANENECVNLNIIEDSQSPELRTKLTKSSFNFDDSSEDEFLPLTKRKKTGKSIVNENENTSETTANAANENECVDLNIIEDSQSPELNTDLSKVKHDDSVQPDANSVALNQSPVSEKVSTPVMSTFSDEETQPYVTSDDFVTLPKKESQSKGHDGDTLLNDATSVYASDSTLDDDQPIRNSVKKATRKRKPTLKTKMSRDTCSSDESEDISILEEKTSHLKKMPDPIQVQQAECPVCFCLFSLKVIEQHASECNGKKTEPQTRRRLGVRNVVDKAVSSSHEEMSTLQTDLHSPVRQDCDIATVSSKSSNVGRRLMRKRNLSNCKAIDNISLVKQGSSKIQSAKTQQKHNNRQTVESESSGDDFSDGSKDIPKMSNSQGRESENVCTPSIEKAKSKVSYSNSQSSEKESKIRNFDEIMQNKSTIDNRQSSKQRNKDVSVKQLIEINDSSDTEDESANHQRNLQQSDTNSEEIPVQMERRSPPVLSPCEEQMPDGQECPMCSAVVQPADFEAHVVACVDLQEARQFAYDSEDSNENQTQRVSRRTRNKPAT